MDIVERALRRFESKREEIARELITHECNAEAGDILASESIIACKAKIEMLTYSINTIKVLQNSNDVLTDLGPPRYTRG